MRNRITVSFHDGKMSRERLRCVIDRLLKCIASPLGQYLDLASEDRLEFDVDGGEQRRAQ